MPKRQPGEPYYRVDSDEAATHFGDEDVLFVDVRRPDEYAEGMSKAPRSSPWTTFSPE